jgi:hypothetical protein
MDKRTGGWTFTREDGYAGVADIAGDSHAGSK